MFSKPGPIIIAEDDPDDQDLLKEVLESFNLPNPLLFFADGVQALEYLRSTSEQPFVIICDINMPKMNGLSLRGEIEKDESLKRKSIPFIFVSTDVSVKTVCDAYDMTVQGFFKKSDTVQGIREMLRIIIEYWGLCKHPNN